jgi:alpha-beta hydrolase superfamily lysophospholipase
VEMHQSTTEHVEFLSAGQRVVGVIHSPQHCEARQHELIITCHGFFSSKDSQKYLEIADRFSVRGLAVLRFDFRGNGESEGSYDILSNRIMDLKAAIEFAFRRGYKSIGLLGSSFGGTTAIIVASETPEIKCLVTWSTPCKLLDLFESISTKDVKGRSISQVPNRRAVGTSGLVEDLAGHDVTEASKRLSNILVIHCKGDNVVPWKQAKIIYANAKEPKRLKIFEKGDHQLLNRSIRKEAIELSLNWSTKFL